MREQEQLPEELQHRTVHPPEGHEQKTLFDEPTEETTPHPEYTEADGSQETVADISNAAHKESGAILTGTGAKEWLKKHKVMAIGGGLAAAALLALGIRAAESEPTGNTRIKTVTEVENPDGSLRRETVEEIIPNNPVAEEVPEETLEEIDETELDRITSISLFPDYLTEAAIDAEQIIFEKIRNNEPLRANDTEMEDRNTPFWRGNATFDFEDAEGERVTGILVNPLEITIGDTIYWVARNPDTRELITLPIGKSQDGGRLYEADKYFETFPYSIEEDPFSGQYAFARPVAFNSNTLEVRDHYAGILRNENTTLYPEVHFYYTHGVEGDGSSFSIDRYGTYKEALYYSKNDDVIYRDHRAIDATKVDQDS